MKVSILIETLQEFVARVGDMEVSTYRNVDGQMEYDPVVGHLLVLGSDGWKGSGQCVVILTESSAKNVPVTFKDGRPTKDLPNWFPLGRDVRGVQ